MKQITVFTAAAFFMLAQVIIPTSADARNIAGAFKAASTGANTTRAVATAAKSTKTIASTGGGSLARSSSSATSAYKGGSGAGSLGRAASTTKTAATGQGSLARTASTTPKPQVFTQTKPTQIVTYKPAATSKTAFNSSAKPLTQGQIQNVQRFQKKHLKNQNITYQKLPNNGVAVQSFAPARNSGYGKMYEKQISNSGKTVNFGKTTYDATKPAVKILKSEQRQVLK